MTGNKNHLIAKHVLISQNGGWKLRNMKLRKF